MRLEIREEPVAALAEHARIAMTVEVSSVLDVRETGLGGIALVEKPVAPWRKDYDADNPPASWSQQFDLRNWGLVSAWDGATRVGGAVIAFDTPGLNMLEGRHDLAVFWDIRVTRRRARVG